MPFAPLESRSACARREQTVPAEAKPLRPLPLHAERRFSVRFRIQTGRPWSL